MAGNVKSYGQIFKEGMAQGAGQQCIHEAFGFITNVLAEVISAASREISGTSIKKNVIEIPCLCSSDIPLDVQSGFCKAIEVLLAMLIKTILTNNPRTRFSQNASSMFKDIPLLTWYDKLQESANGALNDISKALLFIEYKNGNNKAVDGENAVSIFMDSFEENMEKLIEHCIAMEADATYSESKGMIPTFIEIDIYNNMFMDLTNRPQKNEARKVVIGVRVIPIPKSTLDIRSFVVKRNKNEVGETSKAIAAKKTGFFKGLLKKIGIIKERLVNTDAKMDVNDLYTTFQKVAGIQKPFE